MLVLLTVFKLFGDVVSENARQAGQPWGSPSQIRSHMSRQVQELQNLDEASRNRILAVIGNPNAAQDNIPTYAGSRPGEVPLLLPTQISDKRKLERPGTPAHLHDVRVLPGALGGSHAINNNASWQDSPVDRGQIITLDPGYHTKQQDGRIPPEIISHELGHAQQSLPKDRITRGGYSIYNPNYKHEHDPREHGADATVIHDSIRRLALQRGDIKNYDDPIPSDVYENLLKNVYSPQWLGSEYRGGGGRKIYYPEYIDFYNNSDPDSQKYLRNKVVRNSQEWGGSQNKTANLEEALSLRRSIVKNKIYADYVAHKTKKDKS